MGRVIAEPPMNGSRVVSPGGKWRQRPFSRCECLPVFSAAAAGGAFGACDPAAVKKPVSLCSAQSPAGYSSVKQCEHVSGGSDRRRTGRRGALGRINNDDYSAGSTEPTQPFDPRRTEHPVAWPERNTRATLESPQQLSRGRRDSRSALRCRPGVDLP